MLDTTTTVVRFLATAEMEGVVKTTNAEAQKRLRMMTEVVSVSAGLKRTMDEGPGGDDAMDSAPAAEGPGGEAPAEKQPAEEKRGPAGINVDQWLPIRKY